MKFVVRDAKDQASEALIKKYGLDVHGMVITDGADDSVVWKESGHNQTKEGVKAAIDKVLSE